MNRIRRKALQDLADKIAALQEELDILGNEEAEYRDNMPENFYGSERYEKADAACDCLGAAYDSLQEAMDSIARDAINEQYHDQEPESYPW